MTALRDALFDVIHKTVIGYCGGSACIGKGDARGKNAACSRRDANDGYRIMILLNDDFYTLLDVGKSRVEVARGFSLIHVNGGHRLSYR